MAVTSDVERNKQVVCDQIAAMERLDAEVWEHVDAAYAFARMAGGT